ncbi:MAG: ABC transporter ATP-binding protein/permease [Candidatus Izimaplasma sp.]|nr:ABC transporter ATP-binding protein/permease [Candidatus Izimaplasma bacterium]
MIKLNHLHKYYNKNKQNEIHVIDDADITLPSKGLVMLVGPSGSGKTTLLNVLGGLDKVNSGSIEFGDTVIEKYKTTTWDMIRNREVGYIFQNYNLLKNLTVYDNIALTLNMIGIYDQAEIDNRIDYILDAMGMINYRKRKAAQLSGGQQQRVAIARALAKNPSVIIADEPTGNLDSKNTQDIMNIIKSISFNKLVVLVTHEEGLASQYADRIIRLKDGAIVEDIKHNATGAHAIKHDTDIYLKDLKQRSTLSDDHLSVSSYFDEAVEDDIQVRLIAKNKTLYIDVQSKVYDKLNLIDKDSEVRIFNEHFVADEMSPFNEEAFDLDSVITDEKDTVKHSVITVKDSLKMALKRLKDTSRLGKLFYLGFALGAILIALAVGMLSGIFRIQPETFVNNPVETVSFRPNDLTYNEVLDLADSPDINYLYYTKNAMISVVLPTIYQGSSTTQNLSRQIVYSDYLDPDDIIMGRAVSAPNEFVINKYIAEQLLRNSNMNYIGITNLEDLLSLNYHVTLQQFTYDMKLVGIADSDNPVIYMKEETAIMVDSEIGVYELFADDITQTSGDPLSSGSVWVHEDMNYNLPTITFGTSTYDVVGTYSGENLPITITSLDTLKEALYNKQHTSPYALVFLHSNDVSATLERLTDAGVEPTSTYEEDLSNYRSQRWDDTLPTIIFTFVVLGASAISYFFIIRSSLLSRIYEISVYRALGVSKGDIRKIFVTEIALITTFTSLIGYLGMSFVLYRIQLLSENYMDLIYISPLSIIGGVVLIYLVNTLSGLIPVTNLLRRTPAEILSKYDF